MEIFSSENHMFDAICYLALDIDPKSRPVVLVVCDRQHSPDHIRRCVGEDIGVDFVIRQVHFSVPEVSMAVISVCTQALEDAIRSLTFNRDFPEPIAHPL
ncbi:MAG: hypothetical protein OXN16_08455 [Gammaproteobacteria bacterium]|nr:hypothetical protein [Gammaproteobacteria bacterium]